MTLHHIMEAIVTINSILNDTVSLIGNVLAIVFYIAFSPLICLLMLVYPEPEDPREEPKEEEEGLVNKLRF